MKPKRPLTPLSDHVAALQTCVYCPKLCRAACPVSNASGAETTTPWGKMSLAYFAYRGDMPLDEEHTLPVWACTTCEACRQRCAHDNAVATVLTTARAALRSVEVAADGARAVVERFSQHQSMVRQSLEQWQAPLHDNARTVLLVGCSYVRLCPDVARSVLDVVAHLVAEPVRVVRSCCGLPLRLAGDQTGFARAAGRLRDEIADAERVIVADPGCARTLLEHYPPLGVQVPSVTPLVDVVAASLQKVVAGKLGGERLRYFDPCQLGRGLGRYDEPRTILAHLTGQPPQSFVRSGDQGECSGGGGLLPITHPQLSRAIADERIAEHRAAGRARLVTACGGSLHRFRSRGEDAVDLVSLVAEALS